MTLLEAPDESDELSGALVRGSTGGIESDIRFDHQWRLAGVGGHGPPVPVGTLCLAF